MQLQDLLNLLREEFALDIPNAHEAHALWLAKPEEGAACAAVIRDFVERSMQASAMLSLEGFVAYLQVIRDSLGLAEQGKDSAYLQWLSGWIEPAVAYLDAPAHENAVLGICSYLMASPDPLPQDLIEMLAEMLAVPASLPQEDETSNQQLEAATEADVSLATEELDAGLMSALLADAPEQLQRLGDIIETLASDTAPDPAQLLEGQRIAHTFKGSGNIIGLPGIGRLSHRLEDMMEFALARAQAGQPVPTSAARDMETAVHTLQHMVAHLQGEETAPEHSLAVLQRMLDWVQVIHDGQADQVEFEPLDLGDAQNITMTRKDAAATGTTTAQQATVDSPTLRVRVDSLSRLVRRAGQSIVQTQRMSQLLRNTTERLAELELAHNNLTGRLREFEATVSRQVVQVQQEEGALDALEMDRYDALYTLSRFITEGVQDESELTRQARAEVERAVAMLRDEGYALRNQHKELLDARLVPVKTILPRLKRNVAQTASTTGKQVRLQVTGEQVTMDTDVLERLTEPLLHLLRNAVDHGIEPAEEREMFGKPVEGLITLSFTRVGQEVQVLCADDGRGLDVATIYNKAVEYGLIQDGADLSQDDVQRLILRPGFSTKGEVTEVSGRGVGMDVVNDRVTALKGRLDIKSDAFIGASITLHVPVSSGATQALVARCNGQTLAISSDQISSIATGDIEVQPDGSRTIRGNENEVLPYFELAQWLGFAEQAANDDVKRAIKPIVIARGASGLVALGVDEVVESRELILQDVGRLIRRIPGLIGGALRADGKPMVLLDIPELERSSRSSLHKNFSDALRRRMHVQRTRVLVVDDALSVRRSMQQLLVDGGYDVVMAVDGFDALEKLQQSPPAIMLTDLEMPNLNGLDLTRRIRAMPDMAHMPVIMITSRATEKHKNMATDAGVDEYLSKPYQDADLLAHIRRLATKQAAMSA